MAVLKHKLVTTGEKQVVAMDNPGIAHSASTWAPHFSTPLASIADVRKKCSVAKEFVKSQCAKDRQYAQQMAEAFPAVDPLHHPLGAMILIQVRTPRGKIRMASGVEFHISDDSKDTDKWNTQIGKVIAIGPMAYRDADTLQYWPEGAWIEEGDFVRFPKFGADRWAVQFLDNGQTKEALFIIVTAANVLSIVTGDPLAVKAYV